MPYDKGKDDLFPLLLLIALVLSIIALLATIVVIGSEL